MQLALFIVIVTFTHLSCELQSEPSLDISGEMNKLPQVCQEKLRKQMQDKCHENPYQPLLVEVDLSRCRFKCEEKYNNGRTRGTFARYFYLSDGTPCGDSKVCIDQHCIETCNVPFVKGLRGGQ
ncbi:uncharacterized protein LOC120851139 [Ixodes scapularis]|uniref:uncharacterized protein LOC120851139 n=1 Tax=Ixodes scapularis TaxID=6945 RepID=UPI001A9F8B2D|nr:uncharacterized protein LOC120851139 [Ixodes scapularis]